MTTKKEELAKVLRNHLQIIGCGNCANLNHSYGCETCSSKTSSNSYWCISNEYAEKISEALLEVIDEW